MTTQTLSPRAKEVAHQAALDRICKAEKVFITAKADWETAIAIYERDFGPLSRPMGVPFV